MFASHGCVRDDVRDRTESLPAGILCRVERDERHIVGQLKGLRCSLAMVWSLARTGRQLLRVDCETNTRM